MSDIYSPCFFDQEKHLRQEKCSEYRFQCSCEACVEDWPLVDQLPGALQDTPPHHIHHQIDRRLLPQLGRDLSQLEKTARHHWNTGDTQQSLEYWCKTGQLAEKIFKNPSKMLIVVRKSVQLCLWRLYGYPSLTSEDNDDKQ